MKKIVIIAAIAALVATITGVIATHHKGLKHIA